MQHEGRWDGLVACAHQEEATLTWRQEGGLLGFLSLCFRQGLFSTEKIGFKNSPSLEGGGKVRLKEYKTGGRFWGCLALG